MRDFLSVVGIVLCVATSLYTGVSLSIGFLAAIFICGLLQYGNYELKGAMTSMVRSVAEVKILYLIIFLIGASVSSWLAGGVVQTIMVYGLKAMLGRNVILMTFIITAIAGFFMGTAIGTISTLGIAILGIGAAFNIPLPMLLGAAVSGAFISDKISPLSGLMNLTLNGAGSKYRDAVKSMLITLVPIILLTVVFYAVVGSDYVSSNAEQVQSIENVMNQAFVIHPGLLLLPLIVVGLAFSGKPSTVSIGSGVVIGILFSIFVQGVPLLKSIQYVVFGFKTNSSSEFLNSILRSGGMVGMVEVILIVMGAVALSDLMEFSNMNNRIFGKHFEVIQNGNQLLIRSGVISMIMTVLMCDQTAGIVLPLRILKKKGKEFGVTPAMAVRTISDTGTIIAPLMPWNINALIIFGITGISAVAYAPFAVLCAVSPIVSIVYLMIRPIRVINASPANTQKINQN